MRYRYHLNLAGVLYLAVTLLVGFAATIRPNNLLVWIFGLLLGLIVISGLISGGALFRISMRRLDPMNGRVDRPMIVRYAIQGGSRFIPLFDVRIREVPSRDADSSDWSTFAAGAFAWVMHAGPGETVHAEAVFVPRRRGRMKFHRLEARSSFPFGLIGKSVTIERELETLIFPRTCRIRASAIEKLLGGGIGGGRSGPGTGSIGEYAGLREYRPGDSIRSVAWKRIRPDQLPVVIQRAMPSPPRLILVLDLRRPTERLRLVEGSNHREQEEEAISFVASIAETAIGLGVEVGLRIAGTSMPNLPMRGGRRHLGRLQAQLAAIDLDSERLERKLVIPPPNVASVVVVHVDRVDPSLGHHDAWHLLPANLAEFAARPTEGRAPSMQPREAGGTESDNGEAAA